MYFGFIIGKFVQRLFEVEEVMDVRKISAEETLALRHRVLWPEKSIDFCRVEEDDVGLHFGAFVDGELVCVASVFVSDNVARLRKFATSPEYQGQGIGSSVLKVIILSLIHI